MCRFAELLSTGGIGCGLLMRGGDEAVINTAAQAQGKTRSMEYECPFAPRDVNWDGCPCFDPLPIINR